jgi:hypothetical protein
VSRTSTKTVNSLSSESYDIKDRGATGTVACFALNYELKAIEVRNGRFPFVGTDQSALVNSFHFSHRADYVREAS